MSIDRNYVGQNEQTAVAVLGEVGVALNGAPPQAVELYQLTQSGITKAVRAAQNAESVIDRWINDSDVYPKGRHEKASAAYAQAVEAAQRELAQAQVAARGMAPVLESLAMPTFTGDTTERGFLREEITAIVERAPDKGEALARLAENPRYAGLVVSDFGRHFLLERGLDDRAIESTFAEVKSRALLWNAEHGTGEQRRAAERVGLAEKLQIAQVAAADAVRWRLESMAAKVSGIRQVAERQEAAQDRRRR